MIPVVVRVTSCDGCPFSVVDDGFAEELIREGRNPGDAWICTQGGECEPHIDEVPRECPLRSSSIVVTLAEGV